MWKWEPIRLAWSRDSLHFRWVVRSALLRSLTTICGFVCFFFSHSLFTFAYIRPYPFKSKILGVAHWGWDSRMRSTCKGIHYEWISWRDYWRVSLPSDLPCKYLVPIISTRLFDELAEQHTINCGLSFSSPLHIELHCAIFKAQSARNVPGEAATELT